jgi:hypothetical protein
MNWARVFFGSIVVAVGVLLLLDNTGVLDAGEVIGTWWPVALIVAALFALLADPRHWQVPLIVIVVGIALLLRTLDVVDSLDLVIPALLILIGVFVAQLGPGASLDVFAVFGGVEISVPMGWQVVTRGFPIFGGF